LAPLLGTNSFVQSKIFSVHVYVFVFVCWCFGVCSSNVVELVYVHCDVIVLFSSVPVSIPVSFHVVCVLSVW